MAFSSKKLIHFDFDGVIVDSFAVCFDLITEQFPGITQEEYRKMFHGNIYKHIKTQQVGWTQDEWFRRYRKKMESVAPIEAMRACIEEFSKNRHLTIVSSSEGNAIETFLNAHNLRGHFNEVLGKDFHYDKTHKLMHLHEKHEIDVAHGVLITDTVGDIIEAQHIGMDVIAVTWGFHELESLIAAKPTLIVRSPAELRSALR